MTEPGQTAAEARQFFEFEKYRFRLTFFRDLKTRPQRNEGFWCQNGATTTKDTDPGVRILPQSDASFLKKLQYLRSGIGGHAVTPQQQQLLFGNNNIQSF